MEIQILQTALFVCLLTVLAFQLHSGFNHNPPDWVKVVEILLLLGSGAVAIVAAFVWIWS